jgi:CMP/dCMP kinase
MIITIDGPSASGKSSLAKNIAKKLKINVLHSGLIYRAMAKKILSNYTNIEDALLISDVNAIKYAKNINHNDLNDESLKLEQYATMASQIAKIPEIREMANLVQINFANEFQDVIIEGRDSGTVVFPDAKYKFYITVNLETRARRRFYELQQYDKSAIYETILSDMAVRDKQDIERVIAPLKPATDAIIIDNSIKNIEEIVEEILSHIK